MSLESIFGLFALPFPKPLSFHTGTLCLSVLNFSFLQFSDFHSLVLGPAGSDFLGIFLFVCLLHILNMKKHSDFIGLGMGSYDFELLQISIDRSNDQLGLV